MGTRLELQAELQTLLGTSDKSGLEARCFFQPPESLKMTYPCFVYSLERPDLLRANNLIYKRTHRYELTYLTRDPDDSLIDLIEDHFQMCRLVRTNCKNGLNHYHYDLYY